MTTKGSIGARWSLFYQTQWVQPFSNPGTWWFWWLRWYLPNSDCSQGHHNHQEEMTLASLWKRWQLLDTKAFLKGDLSKSPSPSTSTTWPSASRSPSQSFGLLINKLLPGGLRLERLFQPSNYLWALAFACHTVEKGPSRASGPGVSPFPAVGLPSIVTFPCAQQPG